jgi:hypothetical protein
MSSDSRIIELLTDMVMRFDSLVNEVREMKGEIREMKGEIREVKLTGIRQEALFTRHLQTVEADQNTKILDHEQRLRVLEHKA